jgi:hypothetical protein
MCPQGANDGRRRLAEFNQWLGTLPFKERLVIAGNHDRILQEVGPVEAQRLLSNTTYLENTGVTLRLPVSPSGRCGTVRVFGSPVSCGHSDNKAFQIPPERMAQFREEGLQGGVDVLLTHYTPWPSERSPGRPRYHVCGHAHAAFGVYFPATQRKPDGTERRLTVVSSSICDKHYWPANIPIVFDFFPQQADQDQADALS